MSKNPNPQGKGLVPVLQSMADARARIALPPKHIRQIRSELFTSLFVLGSDFKFQPVIGKSYWLYRKDGRFKLYSIGPHEWCTGQPAQFIGECVLQEDITWTLNLDAAAAADAAFIELVDAEQRRLDSVLDSASSIEEALPGYDASVRFHSRVLTYGLTASLRVSMTRAGINELPYREALGLLTETPDESVE